MLMVLNISIFSGSGSADNEVEQAAVSEVPTYASYALLCVNLLSIPVVANSSSIVGHCYYSQQQETAD